MSKDQKIVIAIHAMLSGKEWDADTLDRIATLLTDNGYDVKGVDEDEG